MHHPTIFYTKTNPTKTLQNPLKKKLYGIKISEAVVLSDSTINLSCMNTLIDDVGSFPLPTHVNREIFDKAYVLARKTLINGDDIKKDDFLLNNFYRVTIDSFKKKCQAGLDVVTYPQHYDMNGQFTDIIHDAMDKGTYLVDEKHAIIPEVHVINQEAKQLCEESREKVLLRVCVTGPMELYLKEIGTTPYKDVLLMFAETVKRFAKNSILNSKYVKTEVVSLDEPSFGFQEISVNKDTMLEFMEKAFDFNEATKQIHLHSASRIADILEIKNLDVLSFEYAASPRNIEAVSRKMLEEADKQIRIGISRTDIDSIMAELYDRGITNPNPEQLVESEEIIRKRFVTAKEKYDGIMTFTGPDCGLGGWPTQEAAQLLLKKTVNSVKSINVNL
jgi:5-methyltetrahydropteroyltriglutamate--homocysteine methyltransferase